jgi:hypothetical protein
MPQPNRNMTGILQPNAGHWIYDPKNPAGNRKDLLPSLFTKSKTFYLPTVSAAGSGSNYTFAGTGFGTKSTTPYFDNFESRSVGAAGGTVGSLVLSTNTGMSISTVRSASGTKSLLNSSFVDNYFPKPYLPLSGNSSRVYASCKMYITGDVTAATVWKMWRIGSPVGSEYSGTPRAGESWTALPSGLPDGTAGEIVNSDGITSYWAHNTAASGAEHAYVKDKWLHCEVEFYAGTVGNSDANMIVRVDGVQVLIWQNRPYLTAAAPDLPDWILLPCQGIDGHPACSVNWDDLYIDESNARLIFTDNATYSSSTKFDVQVLESSGLTNTSISVPPGNTPSFTTGQTAHCHFWNNANSYQYLGTKLI